MNMNHSLYANKHSLPDDDGMYFYSHFLHIPFSSWSTQNFTALLHSPPKYPKPLLHS